MKILGIDVGGANLKHVVVEHGYDFTGAGGSFGETPFPFWTDYKSFAAELANLRKSTPFDSVDGVAITMTAELADCFESKRQGVHFIVDEIERVFSDSCCRYYDTRGDLKDAKAAKFGWAETAASNWHASAWYLFEREKLKDGFLVDIGSTTADIIAVKRGMPVSAGATDLDRLKTGELLYAGIGRTPVCSVASNIDLNGASVSIARELFATMDDVMIWLGMAAPSDESTGTADGRPRSKRACRSRLCRMLCADDLDLSDAELDQLAEQCLAKLQTLIAKKLTKVRDFHPEIPATFIVTGSGKWLAKRAIDQAFVKHADVLRLVEPVHGRIANQAVPAMAVAAKLHCELVNS